MKPIANKITFESEVGNVQIFEHEDGGYVFEFTSGWNNGLHCAVPFKTFDKCYSHIKGRMNEWKKEMKRES
jgi:hypothetical protein